MKKSSLFFGLGCLCFVCILLLNEKENMPNFVVISGSGADREILSHGVCIGTNVILTSAHSVPDDRMKYFIASLGEGRVVSRDTQKDTAILQLTQGVCPSYAEIQATLPHTGEIVSTLLMRSGRSISLTGTIQALNPTLSVYDALGNQSRITPRIETDIPFFPGESGAPIYDSDGKVIDVVHVSKK